MVAKILTKNYLTIKHIAGKQIFRGFRDFRGTQPGLNLWDLVFMIMLLYDMKFKITAFDIIQPSLCVMLLCSFQCIF